jgi:hypothetical protein
VVTEMGLVVTGLLALRGALGPLHVVRSCWKPFVAGVVMGVFVWLCNPHRLLAVLAVTVAAAAIYAAMLVLLRTADGEERSIIRRTMGRSGSLPSA